MQEIVMQWLITIGPYAAGILSLLGLLKVLWPKVKTVWKIMFGNERIESELACLKTNLDFVVEELKGNGGKSLRDSVDRVEVKVDRIELSVDKNIQRQRAFLANSKEMIFEADIEGNYAWVNRTYINKVGKLPSDLMGFGWINVITENERDKVQSDWYQAAEEKRSYEATLTMLDDKGKEFKAYIRSQRMFSESKILLGYIGHIEILGGLDV